MIGRTAEMKSSCRQPVQLCFLTLERGSVSWSQGDSKKWYENDVVTERIFTTGSIQCSCR